MARALASTRVGGGTKMALGCVCATLLSERSLARYVLVDAATSGEHECAAEAGGSAGARGGGSATARRPVGGVLCLALVGCLPAGALNIGCDADGCAVVDAEALAAPAAATAAVALRNTLAHSAAAKAAAVTAGLHESLLHAAAVAANLAAAGQQR
eukprot:33778-Chlamydomonas_euryale.AAC.1